MMSSHPSVRLYPVSDGWMVWHGGDHVNVKDAQVRTFKTLVDAVGYIAEFFTNPADKYISNAKDLARNY